MSETICQPFCRPASAQSRTEFVVGAAGPHHLGPKRRDGLGAPRAYALVHEDHRLDPGLPGAPGDRAAVVAVGRAGDGQTLGAMLARQALDCVGAAERLEAPEPEAVALVLVEQLGDAGLGGNRREPAKRRRRIAGPGPDGVPGGAALLGREDVPLLGPVGRVAVETGVRDEGGGER